MGQSTKHANIQYAIRAFFSRGIMIKVSFGVAVFFVLMALMAPVLTPYDPNAQNLINKLQPPSSEHWFGLDLYGRDLLSRIIYGSQISLMASILSGLIAATVGVFLGLLAGYFERLLRTVILRMMDAMLAISPIIFVLVAAIIMGNSVVCISFAIGLSMVPTYVRMIYGIVLSLRENDYVTAARIAGVSQTKIITKHMLPNCIPSVVVMFAMNLGSSIMMESMLSFLGVGVPPPTATWGTMVADGYQYLLKSPALAIVPGLCITLVVISFNIVGDSLRDSMDPRLRGRI